jgi:hypothetical protein
VLRPVQPIDIPDCCEVEVEIRAFKTAVAREAEEAFPEETITVLSARDRDSSWD